MHKNALNYRTALILSLSISLLINLLFLIMFFYGRDAVMPPPDAVREPHEIDFYRILANFISIFILLFVLYMLNFTLLKLDIPFKSKYVIIVLAMLSATLLLSLLHSVIIINIFDFPFFPERFIRGGLVRDTLLSLLVLFSSQIIFLNEKKKQMAIENETLLAENVRTRYQALKNQIDPHFLFNSLNTLNALIKVDPDKAQAYIQEFSLIFRYTLQNKDILSLEEELKFTQAYCHLMQIRYGENLMFEFSIDERYLPYCIVPLSIQTLVENAIKHNVVSNKFPLKITISTEPGASVKVSNRIRKKEEEQGERIGLHNLAERYRLKFQKEITIHNTDDIFEVILPLIEP